MPNTYILLNSDVKVTENWIEPCIKRFETDEKLAAIQPKILSYTKPDKFEYAGAAGGFTDRFGYPFCRGRILNQMRSRHWSVRQSDHQFSGPAGACMFVKAEAFREVGGFDGDFWAHMEEIDLCWRLKNKSYQVWYEPASVVLSPRWRDTFVRKPEKRYT
jgi:GT2 family glycosyltransferase